MKEYLISPVGVEMDYHRNTKSSWTSYLPRLLELLYPTSDEPPSFSYSLTYNRITGEEIVGNPNRSLLNRLRVHTQQLCHEIDPGCEHCQIRMFCLYWRKNQATQKRKTIHFVDVFCGAGGLSYGLEQNGFSPCLAMDKDHSSAETYLFNRPFLLPHQVRIIDVNEINEHFELPKIPLVVGGSPCQGFSNANQQGLSNDPRNHLYKNFLDIVAKCHADICILENVSGMIRFKKAIQLDFQRIGFEIAPFKLNAKDLGYPQHRERVFWFGLRTSNYFLFESIAEMFRRILKTPTPRAKQLVLADAIMDLDPLLAKTEKNATNVENDDWGYTIAQDRIFDTPYALLLNGGKIKSFLFNHKSKYNNPRDIEIYGRLKPGEKADSESIRDIMPYKRRAGIFRDKFFRLKADEPSKTVTAHMYYDCHMYIHPTQARGLTPREAARIQGFPDNYFFLGYPNEWYRQIGNAVSPLVAKHLAKALAEVLCQLGIGDNS